MSSEEAVRTPTHNRCKECRSPFCESCCYRDSDEASYVQDAIEWLNEEVAKPQAIGLLYSDDGYGKSDLVDYYLEHVLQSPALMLVAFADWSHADLMEALSHILIKLRSNHNWLPKDKNGQPAYPKTLAEHRRTVLAGLQRHQIGCLVIDNAEYLKKTALQELRSLHNLSSLAVVLVGDNHSPEQLKTVLGERVKTHHLLVPLTTVLARLETIPYHVGAKLSLD